MKFDRFDLELKISSLYSLSDDLAVVLDALEKNDLSGAKEMLRGIMTLADYRLESVMETFTDGVHSGGIQNVQEKEEL